MEIEGLRESTKDAVIARLMEENERLQRKVRELEEREKLGIAHSETYKMLCERTRELEEARAEVGRLREALEHIIEIVARLAIVDPGSKGFCKRIYDEAEQALEGGGK